SVAFSADGQWFASVAEDLVWLRRASDFSVEHRFPPPGRFGTSLSFSPDSRILACAAASPSSLALYPLPDTTQLWFADLPDYPNRVQFSPDGSLVACAFNNGLVRLYRAD